MRFRTLRGLAVLAMLVGALGVGATAHAAAPTVGMAKLCSNGAYVLYMDENGDQFASEAACAAWTKKHPGQPPIAIDNDPDGHPDQPSVNSDDSTDDAADQSGTTTNVVTNGPNVQSAGKVLIVVSGNPDDAAATDDASDNPTSDDGSDNGDG